MDSNNLIKQLLMVGIGTTSLMAEKLKEVSDQWVQDGKLNSDQAQNFVDDLMQQVRHFTRRHTQRHGLHGPEDPQFEGI